MKERVRCALSVAREAYPIAGEFRIARGAKRVAEVVVVTLEANGVRGRGECVPYARYGESCEGVMSALAALSTAELSIEVVQTLLPAGAARNALDCALHDLLAKRRGVSVAANLGLGEPSPVLTAYTLSIDTPERTYARATELADRPLLKVKLAGEDDVARLEAVRKGAPAARLVVDANEGLDVERYLALLPVCTALGVELLEQPFPAGNDEALASLPRPIPVCADESFHDRQSLDALAGRYDVVCIKLDKTGGLTEALKVSEAARARGLARMVGCMVATSLSMAPALLVAQGAELVDLDGPLLLERDREGGIRYEGSRVFPPQRALWG